MKYLSLIFLIFLIYSCSKPKTVLICGDHICINKAEAEQYFEEHLSLEVKVVNKKMKNEANLIELNLIKDPSGKKKITLFSKKKPSEDLKTLSNDEKLEIKKDINKRKKEKKMAKKIIKKEKRDKDLNIKKKSKNLKEIKNKSKKNKIDMKNVNKSATNVVDVCTILEKCSIEEISKLLLEQGRNKKFPDITIRQ